MTGMATMLMINTAVIRTMGTNKSSSSSQPNHAATSVRGQIETAHSYAGQ